jgi:hypothetical protein
VPESSYLRGDLNKINAAALQSGDGAINSLKGTYLPQQLNGGGGGGSAPFAGGSPFGGQLLIILACVEHILTLNISFVWYLLQHTYL